MNDMTSEQKAELLLSYKKHGGKELRNEIVIHYMNIVKYAAISTRNIYLSYADREDIVNEAVIGLIHSIESFDPEKNVKFETYASVKVRGAIIDYIRRQDIVPRKIRKFARDYEAAYSALYAELDREPAPFEIAERMELKTEKLEELSASAAAAHTLSLEELMLNPAFDLPEEGSEEGLWSAEERIHCKEKINQLAKAIESLTERQRLIVTLYYYEKLKFSDIGKVLELSESRICQIHSESVVRMKKFMADYIN
ncbi:MAG: FliA/WhiG family RNA polymerase sigma factor [Oscillospiraceae bacterium]|nr:FliA/WhiG family RNA polymerase sigma factor [Oscillospiraceae bacterium]